MNIQKKAQTLGRERFACENNKARAEWAPNKDSKKYFTALFPAVEALKRPVTHLPAFAKRLPLTLGVHQDILAAGHNKKTIQRFLAWWISQIDYPRSLTGSLGVLRYDLCMTPAHSAHLRGQSLQEINHDGLNQLIQLHLSDGATKCPCQSHNRDSATDSQAGWREWRQPRCSSRWGRANDEL